MAQTILPNNPYITLQEDRLCLHFGKTHHDIDLQNIGKIHISKRKSGRLEGFMSQLMRIPQTDYYLNIETYDKGSFKITINPLQRFFCIRLLSILRPQISLNRQFKRDQPPTYVQSEQKLPTLHKRLRVAFGLF